LKTAQFYFFALIMFKPKFGLKLQFKLNVTYIPASVIGAEW